MSEAAKPEQADRSEIEAHVTAYSHWWKRYDDILAGKLCFLDPRMRQLAESEADERWFAACQWLWEHGVPDHTLLYDRETKIFMLPADWAPPKG